MILRPYDDRAPSLGQRVFVAENATIVGDVVLGDDCSIWYGAVLRGDVHSIRIGARTNIQDNCVLHVTNGTHPIEIAEEVTIGHGVIAHGCSIGRGALIGMGSRVLDGARVGELALIGAGALVGEGMEIPPRTLAVGVPAKVKRELRIDEIVRLEQSWRNYIEYKEKYLEG
ncbi:MAG TPA: gamma carbonic anhydrase family protein [Thermoanaerobaculia bacterium]|nr:gamma carbonic anhydrase family protein [Thermoanaerobaculia bacterium]